MLRVLVTGSRTWSDRQAIELAMALAWQRAGRPEQVTLVHGGARGADAIAEAIARRQGWAIERHLAKWDEHGRRAGVVRNAAMVAAGADVCLAFIADQSRGATHCADLAERAGIATQRHQV